MFKIVWTPLAFDSYQKIFDFVLENWTIQTVIELDQKVKEFEQNLLEQQFLCPSSKSNPNLRKCVISNHTSMIYRVSDNLIEIIAFVDNRAEHGF